MEKKTKESVFDRVSEVDTIVILSRTIIRSLDLVGKEDCDKASFAFNALYFVSAYYLEETDPTMIGKYLHEVVEILSTSLDEEDVEKMTNAIKPVSISSAIQGLKRKRKEKQS